jgi:inosose dehydratase
VPGHGHVAYAGGDNRAIITAHPDRIGYVHLKSIDPDVLAKVRAEGLSFARPSSSAPWSSPASASPRCRRSWPN